MLFAGFIKFFFSSLPSLVNKGDRRKKVNPLFEFEIRDQKKGEKIHTQLFFSATMEREKNI